MTPQRKSPKPKTTRAGRAGARAAPAAELDELDPAQVLMDGGADGIEDAGEDDAADDGSLETVVKPGPDGLLGTADDETTELSNFTREIVISPLNFPNTTTVNPSLRQITVNIRYLVDSAWRTYSLTTYVSSFS